MKYVLLLSGQVFLQTEDHMKTLLEMKTCTYSSDGVQERGAVEEQAWWQKWRRQGRWLEHWRHLVRGANYQHNSEIQRKRMGCQATVWNYGSKYTPNVFFNPKTTCGFVICKRCLAARFRLELRSHVLLHTWLHVTIGTTRISSRRSNFLLFNLFFNKIYIWFSEKFKLIDQGSTSWVLTSR